MTRTNVAIGVAVIAAVAISVGCGNGNEQPASESAPAAVSPAGAAQAGADITLRTNPDPVRTGENTFEVMVMQGSQPVTDADVSLELFMAAMPSMNMPEMRVNVPLTAAGDGRYRGTGSVSMGGAWDANVMVMRGGQHLGDTKVTIVAK
jgi:hypothetical protein